MDFALKNFPWMLLNTHLIQNVVVHIRIPLFKLIKLSPKLIQCVNLPSLVKNCVGAFALKLVFQILPNVPVTCTLSCLQKDDCHPLWMLGCLSDINTKPFGLPITSLSFVRNQLHNSSLSKSTTPKRWDSNWSYHPDKLQPTTFLCM